MSLATSDVRRVPRLLLVCFWLQLKVLATSAFEGFLAVVWPLFFATAAFLVYRINGDQQAMVYAGLGAAVMGIWSAIAVSASNVLSRERWAGTLELLVASPTAFALILVPITTAMASLGLYSLGATLLWGWLFFGIDFTIENPLVFALSIIMSILTIALFGFLLSVCAVRYRTAWALGAAMEYPGWLLCGFVVPLTVLPTWVHPLSYALAPTWAMKAIRASAAGSNAWADLGVCALLGIVYAIAATFLARALLRSARRNATLSLT